MYLWSNCFQGRSTFLSGREVSCYYKNFVRNSIVVARFSHSNNMEFTGAAEVFFMEISVRNFLIFIVFSRVFYMFI